MPNFENVLATVLLGLACPWIFLIDKDKEPMEWIHILNDIVKERQGLVNVK